MKTTGLWAAAAFLSAPLAGNIANAQDANFILANNTAFTVSSVYIWPTGSPYQGPDLLEDTTIDSGDTYPFEPDAGVCTYNIRVVLEAAYQKQWNGVDLCRLSTLTLTYNYLNRNLSASRQ
jgi:hypothetical protein